MAFDPDVYLAPEKPAGFDPDAYLKSESTFNPDAYLKSSPDFDPDVYLGTKQEIPEFRPASGKDKEPNWLERSWHKIIGGAADLGTAVSERANEATKIMQAHSLGENREAGATDLPGLVGGAAAMLRPSPGEQRRDQMDKEAKLGPEFMGKIAEHEQRKREIGDVSGEEQLFGSDKSPFQLPLWSSGQVIGKGGPAGIAMPITKDDDKVDIPVMGGSVKLSTVKAAYQPFARVWNMLASPGSLMTVGLGAEVAAARSGTQAMAATTAIRPIETAVTTAFTKDMAGGALQQISELPQILSDKSKTPAQKFAAAADAAFSVGFASLAANHLSSEVREIASNRSLSADEKIDAIARIEGKPHDEIAKEVADAAKEKAEQMESSLSQAKTLEAEKPSATIDRVAKQTSDEFFDWTRNLEAGFTGEAHKLGDSIIGDEPSIARLREAAKTGAEEARSAIESVQAAGKEATPEMIQNAITMASKGQFFNEALAKAEAASPRKADSGPIEPISSIGVPELGARDENVSKGNGSATPYEEKVLKDQQSLVDEHLDAQNKTEINSALGQTPDAPLPSERLFGIKNASVEAERKMMGLPEFDKAEVIAQEKSIKAAGDVLDSDPTAGARLIDSLAKDIRPATTLEQGLIGIELAKRTQEFERARASQAEAVKSGDQIRIDDAKQRVEKARDGYRVASEINEAVGRQTGRSLALRRAMLNQDYTYAGIERRAIDANGGNALPKETTAKIEEVSRKLGEVERKYDDYKKRMSELLMSDTPAERRGPPKALGFLSKQAEAARSRIKARIAEGRYHSGIDPVDLADHGIIAAEYIARGVKEIGALTTEMVKEFGEWIKPHMESIYKQAQDLAEKAELDGLLERRKAALIKRIDELQEKVDSGDISTSDKSIKRPSIREIEELEQQRDSLSEELSLMRESARKVKELEDAIKEKEEKIKSGDLSPKGKPINRPSGEGIEVLKQQRDKLNESLRKARVEAAKPSQEEIVAKKVEDLNKSIEEKKAQVSSGNVAPRHGAVNRPQVKEIELAKREVEALNAEIAEMRKPAPKTEEQLRVESLDKQIAEVERQIRADEVFPDRKKLTISSPEIESREKRLKLLQEERQFARDRIQPRPDAKSKLDLAKDRTQKRISELKKEIATETFSKKKASPIKPDMELARIQAERASLQEQADGIEERLEYERSGLRAKIGKQFTGLWDNARNIMAGGEFSFIMRQGGLFAKAHPIKAATAMPEMWRALVENPDEARAINIQQINEPIAKEAKSFGLHLSEHGRALSRQEEFLLQDKFAAKVPIVSNGIARFAAAGTTLLNRYRIEYWKMMADGLKADDVVGKQALAKFINQSTGYGSLGPLEHSATFLARVFFSPRYWSSRLQLAVGHSMWDGSIASRKIIAKEYARIAITQTAYIGALYAAAKLANQAAGSPVDVESNPLSSGFGKIRIGNTRIDTLAGMAQVFTYLSRVITGSTKTAGGKIQSIRGNTGFGKQDTLDVTQQYVRGKLHPLSGLAVTAATGKNFYGAKADLKKEALNLLYPMTYGDMVDAFKEHGISEGTALSILLLIGEGANTYQPNKTPKLGLPK